MQPLGKQPSYRSVQPSGEPEAATGPTLAPASAVNALMGRLGLARTQDEPDEDESVLTANLADPSWIVRVSAVQKLGKMGKQAPLGLLLAAIRDEQSGVRVAAARALSRNTRQAAIAALVAALEDREWLVRAEATLALGEMRELAPLAPLLAALEDKDATVRASAAKALGETNSEKALEPLNAALQDEDWSVREAATLALIQLELEGQPSIPPLLNARMDRDPAVREAAETGLLHIYPDIISVPPPPSDSLAHWLERIEFPHSASLVNTSLTTHSLQKKKQQDNAHAANKRRGTKAPRWSHKAMNAAEGVLAAVIITSLFIVWLAIETQPRSTQGQASPNNSHDITFTTYREHNSEVKKAAWSPDGQDIASTDIRGTVLIWQASTSKTLMMYSQRGTILALTWAGANEVLVAYAETNKELQVVELILSSESMVQQTPIIFQQSNLSATPTAAAWSSDKQTPTLAFDTGDGSIQISNVVTGQLVTTIHEKHTLYNELAWSPDNNQLAALSTTGLLEIWDTYTGLPIVNLTDNHLASFAVWISGGHYQSGVLLVDSSSTLLEWSYSYGRKSQKISTFLAQQMYNFANTADLFISDLAISPDSSQLLLATSDGLVQTRDMRTGNLLYLYADHSAQVNDIEWSPNGQHIATASRDTTVRVWQEP